MTEVLTVLAFGGPMNEQMLAIPADRHTVQAIRPLPLNLSRIEEPINPTSVVGYREITYRVERVGYHDISKRRLGVMQRCSDSTAGCQWSARCLVADGYPTHRITDTLNAIAGMSTLLSSGKVKRHPWWRRALRRLRKSQ